ncbi:MAG TPA: hypothetical protein VFQ95_00230 [Rhodanobacteraceae bacterium]|nr:hypothetical protein [Rhodanobacteraceae bacterium]
MKPSRELATPGINAVALVNCRFLLAVRQTYNLNDELIRLWARRQVRWWRAYQHILRDDDACSWACMVLATVSRGIVTAALVARPGVDITHVLNDGISPALCSLRAAGYRPSANCVPGYFEGPDPPVRVPPRTPPVLRIVH